MEIVSSRNIFVRVCELRRILQARGARTWANVARRGALAGIGAARQFQPLDPATHLIQGSRARISAQPKTEWRSLLAHQFPLLTHLCHLPRWASAPNLVQNFALGCCNGVLHSTENKRGRPPSTVLISLSNRRRSTKQDSGAKAIGRSGPANHRSCQCPAQFCCLTAAGLWAKIMLWQRRAAS